MRIDSGAGKWTIQTPKGLGIYFAPQPRIEPISMQVSGGYKYPSSPQQRRRMQIDSGAGIFNFFESYPKQKKLFPFPHLYRIIKKTSNPEGNYGTVEGML